MAKASKAKANGGKKVSPNEDDNNDSGGATVESTEETSIKVDEQWIVDRFLDPNDDTTACDCTSERDCNNSKAVAVWIDNSDPTREEWPYCVACSQTDFGEWPDEVTVPDHVVSQTVSTETSMDTTDETTSTGKEETNSTDASSTETTSEDPVPMQVEKEPVENDAATATENVTTSTATETSAEMECDPKSEAIDPDEKTNSDETSKDQDGDVENPDQMWELKKILSILEVTDRQTKCSNKGCETAAACIWSGSENPNVKWHTCLDCQETDFGWPEIHELPIQHMTQEHKRALVFNCSKSKSLQTVDMPNFPASPTKESDRVNLSNSVTPLPNGATQTTGKKHGKATVTPSPGVDLASTKPKAKAKPNKALLAAHSKWQAAATAIGGPGARIVVDNLLAKKILLDHMSDAFRPKTITQIYKELKGTIPSPVLKICLDDMAFDKSEDAFADSDDEDKPSKKKKPPKASDNPYKGSICYKSGKSVNSGFYYLNYTKTKNNGDGLVPDERNELVENFHKTTAELTALKDNIKGLNFLASKLLSEPTNEELTGRLETEESALNDMREKVEAARKLKVNEKHKKQLHARSKYMTTEWRKRRSLCMDFLYAMEENSDGTVSAKKCLKGDGQIPIESDETAIVDAKAYAKMKRARGPLGSKKRVFAGNIKPGSSKMSSLADESFVGVTLDKQGRVERVYLNDDE